MPLIHTLTGNLLAEYTLDYENWKPNSTQRAGSSTFQVGGKGINVSKMLHRLGTPTLALCFAGGSTGNQCLQWLQQQKIPHKNFPSKTPTRLGLVIRKTAAPPTETTFLGPDQPPTPAALAACAKFINKLTTTGTSTLALTGSFPGWNTKPAAPLRTALAKFAQTNTLVADTYGPPLATLTKLPLRLVKINRAEFDAFLPPLNKSDTLPRRLLRASQTLPPLAWIITDGPKPIHFIEKNSAPKTIRPKPLKKPTYPTGSGDVLLALILHSLLNGKNTLASALRTALPFASKNASHKGVADFKIPAAKTIEAH